MSTSIRRRSALALAAVLALVATLTACSPPWDAQPTSAAREVATSANPAPRVTTDPAVRAHPGDCWNEPDHGEVATWRWWEGGAAVDCSAEHAGITYALAEVPPDFRYPEVGPDGKPVFEQPERVLLHERCQAGGLLNDGIEDGSRIAVLPFFPDPEQWAKGERWVRCDLGVQAMGPVREHPMEALPATVPEVLADVFGTYRRCLDTPLATEENRPLGALDRSEHVPCEGAQWVFASSIEFDPVGWPGAEAIALATQPLCLEDLDTASSWRTGAVVTTPTERDWGLGWRTAECWLF